MDTLTKVKSGAKVDASAVAAITAALLAGGYLHAGKRLAGVKKISGQMSPWKRAGILELMKSREF